MTALRRGGHVTKMRFNSKGPPDLGGNDPAADSRAIAAARVNGGLLENLTTYTVEVKFVAVAAYTPATSEITINVNGKTGSATTVDTDGDGMGDSLVFDSNGDGVQDTVLSLTLATVDGQATAPISVKCTSPTSLEIYVSELGKQVLTAETIEKSLDAWGELMVAANSQTFSRSAISDFTVTQITIGSFMSTRSPATEQGEGVFDKNLKQLVTNELAAANYMMSFTALSEVLVPKQAQGCCTIA